MEVQEKRIIESILADVGLEPLNNGTERQEPKTEKVKLKHTLTHRQILK